MNKRFPLIAAAALMSLGGIADAPAFGTRSPVVTAVHSFRAKDKRDKKRRKAVKAKPRKRVLFSFSAKTSTSSEDLRHDKYLHSHAKSMRRLTWALSHRGQPYPFNAPDYRPNA